MFSLEVLAFVAVDHSLPVHAERPVVVLVALLASMASTMGLKMNALLPPHCHMKYFCLDSCCHRRHWTMLLL